MGMGRIVWACLLLTMNQAPAPEFFMDTRRFEIPIRINPQRRNEVQELTLYVSRDEGATWEQAGTKSPTEKAFVYLAKQDGPYWFIVQQKDRDGRPNPSNPMAARPNQRIVVDTLKPRVQVTAERLPGGDVLARWTITEEHPDPQSLRIEYRTAEMPPTAPPRQLPVDPQSGQNEIRFPPGSTGEVRVRVRIKDQAQNTGEGEAVVPATSAAGPVGGADGPAFGVIPTMQGEKGAPAGQLASRQSPHPPDHVSSPSHSTPGSTPMQLTAPDELNAANHHSTGGATGAGAPDRSPASSDFAPRTPRGGLPELKIVNKREVKLDFEVAKFGPSGLSGTAEVYVTTNEGATWSRLSGELPVTLPPTSDVHGATPVRGSVSVQLPAEATIYGFIVAVKSKAGLARPAPKSGELPQARIELDLTPPKGELLRPIPDPSQRDTLQLAWRVSERNLPSNPITLEWAERKEGPWHLIGEGALPNSGQYAWHLPDGVPALVHLKLTMRDAAGNVAVAQTEKPQLIDLSVPETNIIGVAPTSR